MLVGTSWKITLMMHTHESLVAARFEKKIYNCYLKKVPMKHMFFTDFVLLKHILMLISLSCLLQIRILTAACYCSSQNRYLWQNLLCRNSRFWLPFQLTVMDSSITLCLKYTLVPLYSSWVVHIKEKKFVILRQKGKCCCKLWFKDAHLMTKIFKATQVK